jgi:methylmalonyl-CoA/ethylmalonyl-CoA epimerase
MQPDTASTRLASIGQVHINARDLTRATAFYRDVLGLRFLFEVPHMSFFECGGVRLMLGVAEKSEFDHPSSILYYNVEDLGAAHAALVGRGVRFAGEPHKVADLGETELWMAFFRDSEENLMALMNEVARA